jgi:hypothetical protein
MIIALISSHLAYYLLLLRFAKSMKEYFHNTLTKQAFNQFATKRL